MIEQLRKEAHKFMFKEFGKSIWWEVKDLTRAGNPAGNPPDLNKAEAESIFRDLFKMDLVIPTKNKDGEDCFIMHQARYKQWKDLINPPSWFQRNWKPSLKYLGVFILFSLSLIYSSWIRKTVENRVEKLNEKIMKWTTVEKQGAQSKENTQTNEMSH